MYVCLIVVFLLGPVVKNRVLNSEVRTESLCQVKLQPVFAFFPGRYFSDSGSGMRLRDVIVTLCGALKDDAVALVDAIAPPDFVLHSALGHSNGEVGDL